ncbi:MAG: NYN domain-containing protein [Coriobacteriia bacterium]|nr:NYN domain-containing protein [Coriobacteriia bacterium]
MLILVDGYNVTMRDPALAGRSKQAQRDALSERLRSRASRLAPRGRIVVVFDARESIGASSETIGALQVAYAADADSEIVRRASGASGQVVVYTDDLRLRARISQDVGRHVEYRDVSALFVGAKPAPGKRLGSIAAEEGLPKGAKDITAELGELWLDENGE